MKKKFFFSVVIPTFNSEKTILQTLSSVKKQTFKNFQIVLIDDGSTDNTVRLIKNFIKNNNLNIKLYEQKNSGGPAAPRNLGINKSEGENICFLDADDYWFSNKLKDAHYLLKEKKDIDVLTSNEIMIYKNKKTKLTYGPVTKSFYLDLLLQGNKLSTSATIVRKSFLIKNKIFFNEDKNISSVEDYDYWLQIAKKSGNFYFLNKFHGLYLLNKNSISKNRILHFRSTINVVDQHIKQLNPTNKKISLILRVKIRIFISFLIISIKELNYKLFIKIIKNMVGFKI